MKTRRVADVVMDYLVGLGIDHVFTVTGGGAMFLNDAVAANENLHAVCNHHEQACSMAAVGYAKYRNSYAAAVLTTGCGSTNAMTGLLDAWQDNVPCIFISGQVKKRETTRNCTASLRQFGVQEADIVSMVSSFTKYSIMVNEPEDIVYHLEKAAYMAKSGRPGPVWIDIPLDVQGASVKPDVLRSFKPDQIANSGIRLSEQSKTLSNMLAKSSRPIIIAGNGIRLGNAVDKFRNFVDNSKIPVTVSYLGVDLLPSNHPQYIGRLGIKGDRAGNFAVQNADLVISMGCHLSVALTGFEYDLFAREAELVVIDIDPEEHKKDTVKIDCMIEADIAEILPEISAGFENEWIDWCNKCRKWRDMWPVCLPEYKDDSEGVNIYYFTNRLSEYMPDDAVVVSDAGSSYYVTSQALLISNTDQRYITSGAQADMGFTLPAAIGVCVAMGNKPVVGITGDGSFQMNIQELQTLVHNNYNVKIVVWNNNGYLSIRTTQKKFFSGREIGTDSKSGVSFPDCKKITEAYGIRYMKIDKANEIENIIKEMIDHKGPVICEVICQENQEVIPTVSSVKLPDGRMISKPIEDMYPFLDRTVFKENMIVKPVDEE